MYCEESSEGEKEESEEGGKGVRDRMVDEDYLATCQSLTSKELDRAGLEKTSVSSFS